ncbi:MAG TPA: hypothetical protein VH593_16385 [Ktedonobacteraceae bacterium]
MCAASSVGSVPRSWSPRQAMMLLFFCICMLLSASGCSSNAGVLGGSGSWQASGLQNEHIHTFAVNTNNPNTVYAGDAQGAVFVSTDAALHWSEHSVGLPLPVELHALLFDSGTGQLFAATDKGIFSSNSNVQQWTSVKTSGLAIDSYTALEFNASAPRTLYAGTAHAGVFISRNDGVSWSALHSGWPAGSMVNGLSYDAEQHQLWAATTTGIYHLADGGRSWLASDVGLPAASIAYAVQPSVTSNASQEVLYLGTNHGVYTSQDQGQHWKTTQESLAAVSVYQVTVDFRISSGQTIYISTSAGAFRSDDGGQSWSSIASGLPRAHPVYALALGADNYAQLFAAADSIYQYPGSGGEGFSASRIITILIIVLFFLLLFGITRRNRNRKKATPFPQPPTSTER